MTAEQRQTLLLVAAVGDTVRDVGPLAEGPLYAAFMKQVTVVQFRSIIAVLEAAKLVKREGNHMLRWIGPAEGFQL